VPDISDIVNNWTDGYLDYHHHEALGYLTLAEFSVAMGLSIPKSGEKPEM
jgi:hypothetical protein